MSGAFLMGAKESGSCSPQGGGHGAPPLGRDGFKFPSIQDSCPVLSSSHLTSIAIAVSSFTLSSDQFLPSPLLSPMTPSPWLMGFSTRALLRALGLAWSWIKAFDYIMPS